MMCRPSTFAAGTGRSRGENPLFGRVSLPICRESSWDAEPSSTGSMPCSRPLGADRRRRSSSRVSRAWGRPRCCWRPPGGPSASAVCGREGSSPKWCSRTRDCCRHSVRCARSSPRSRAPRLPPCPWPLGWEPPGAPTDRFLVAAAVLSLLAAEARRGPVLVLVDDLQWVDRESASALGFAARRLRDDPVCFVWAGRSGQIPAGRRPGTPGRFARPADPGRRPVTCSGIGSRIGSPIAWWTTRVAIRWRCSRSRSDSRTRSGSGRHRCPRRRPSVTDSTTCTGSAWPSCPHRPAGRCC